MPVVQPSFKPTISTGAKQIKIEEFSSSAIPSPYQLPDTTKSLTIRARGNSDIFLSMTDGGEYITIKSGACLSLDNIELQQTIVYISSTSTILVEIMSTYT
jgi:hypothetical protein